MSNTDSFIEEVSEEVRRDRLFGYARRYGWIVALALILIVAGTAYFEYAATQKEAQAQARGDAVLAALSADDSDAAIAQLAQTDTSLPVQLLAAQGEGAAARLQALSADENLAPYARDLARLRLAALPDGVPMADRIEILTDLAAPGQTYRVPAMDMLALLYLEDGQNDAAMELMQTAINDAQTPQEQASRFMELIIALGGTPDLGSFNPITDGEAN
ncbi:MAG: hypothetical protein ACWA40_03355 [Planktomarina sp.]